MKKATAIANANIALAKYWGKRDKKLILPQNGSISMTCQGMSTVTTVDFSEKYKEHKIFINDEEFRKDEKDIHGHLDRICRLAGQKQKAKVISKSNFPVAAGLASSASGFAALTMAAAGALGLRLSSKELSILTRQGSGSACRSIFGGFAEWRRGKKPDGSDSYAENIIDKNGWRKFRMIVTILSKAKKETSSRVGMSQTVENCPFYGGWLETIEEDLKIIRKAVLQKDFTKLGVQAEHNCLKMHSLMISTKPSIIYWKPSTIEIIQNVIDWRRQGLECYFTIDAGPNVKVLCLEKNEKEANKRLMALKGVIKTMICRPGDGAKLINKHLF